MKRSQQSKSEHSDVSRRVLYSASLSCLCQVSKVVVGGWARLYVECVCVCVCVCVNNKLMETGKVSSEKVVSPLPRPFLMMKHTIIFQANLQGTFWNVVKKKRRMCVAINLFEWNELSSRLIWPEVKYSLRPKGQNHLKEALSFFFAIVRWRHFVVNYLAFFPR